MNPAQRIERIFDLLLRAPSGGSMLQRWADAFELDKVNEDDVAACVGALRQQIDLTSTLLKGREVTDDLLEPGFRSLRSITAPGLIDSAWDSVRPSLPVAESRQSFKWASWVLRDLEDDDLTSNALHELRAELEALISAVREGNLPEPLRNFIGRQLDLIKQAMRIYPASGFRPLSDALEQVAGMYHVRGQQVAAQFNASDDESKTMLRSATDFVAKVADICDKGEKIRKFGEGAFSIAREVAPLVIKYFHQA